DSRIMKTRRGYVQAYNAQAVATAEQIIVAAEVTPEENDVGQLHPMLAATAEELKAAGVEETVGAALVDAGYCSEENLEQADPAGPELFMATRKEWKQGEQMRQAPAPRGRIPAHLSRRQRMDRKLLTKRGRRLYKQRSQIIEPVFGQTKACRGINRFQCRGLANCQSEWKVICGTHNLLKLWRSGEGRRDTKAGGVDEGDPRPRGRTAGGGGGGRMRRDGASPTQPLVHRALLKAFTAPVSEYSASLGVGRTISDRVARQSWRVGRKRAIASRRCPAPAGPARWPLRIGPT